MSETKQTSVTATLDAHYLREFLTGVEAVTQEMRLTIDDNGMRTEMVDPANVVMVRAELDAEAFQTLDGETTIGVNARQLLAILTTDDGAVVDGASTVTLEYDPNIMKLDLDIGTYRYTYACHDPDTVRGSSTIPEMDLGFVADVPIGALREPVQWFDEFADNVRIGYDPGAGEFWMDGMSDTGDGCYALDRDDMASVRSAKHADSSFSLDYFTDLVERVPDGALVRVAVGEAFPMTMSYDIAWAETGPGEGVSYGDVELMQAPRIQTD